MEAVRRKRERDRPSAAMAMSYAFPPMSDEQLADFLRQLVESLPGDLGARVLAGLDGGHPPATVARMVRDELRAAGHLRSS
jgi:hypothetical protein